MNCLAMWIYLNETEMGPQIGRDLNTFIASFRGHYGPLMEFPVDIIIGVGGKRIRFEKGEEDSFFDTLVSSQEMSFMWRNGFDIQALTDMTNMPIEVTLYDPETTSVENVQTFEPNPNFPWNDNESYRPNTPKYRRNMMKLINYKNLHFNLIVSENDEIVNMLVPQVKSSDKNEQNEENLEIQRLTERLKLSEESKKDLTKRLKLSEESKTKLSVNHKEAMTEIGRMKEEIEKFKIEIKTLSEYKSILRKETLPVPAPRLIQGPARLPVPDPQSQSSVLPPEALKSPAHQSGPESAPLPGVNMATQPGGQVKSPATSSSSAPWTTVVSSNRRNIKRNGSGSETNQRNCPKCYFQSNCKEEMDNHFKMSHVPKGETSNITIRAERMTCRNCKVDFQNYWSLMNHRRDNHPTNKTCRYDLEDRCKHSSEECWYLHKNGRRPNTSNQSESHINECFECNMKFKNKNELMIHRKNNHPELCKPCDKYIKNECTRGESCWFPHTQDQDFQKSQLNTRPPINLVQ